MENCHSENYDNEGTLTQYTPVENGKNLETVHYYYPVIPTNDWNLYSNSEDSSAEDEK